ncbi:MAG: hypothetical protein U0Z75_00315 [Deinococcaceae bacterium]
MGQSHLWTGSFLGDQAAQCAVLSKMRTGPFLGAVLSKTRTGPFLGAVLSKTKTTATGTTIAEILNPQVDPLSNAQRTRHFLEFDLPHMLIAQFVLAASPLAEKSFPSTEPNIFLAEKW